MESSLDIPAILAEHAPALHPLVLADPSIADDVRVRPLARATTASGFRRALAEATQGLGDGPALDRALRRFRHRAIVRIALREVLRLADVDETSAEVARLAEACIDRAVEASTRAQFERHGTPRDASGRVVPFTVLGMGKLGGDELNLGSDVDLCFFHETDEADVPGGKLAPFEIFTRVAQSVTRALSEVTEDGFCFRVDLRLRPEGTRGPLVNSLASAERYYETWGRTWERAALLRARPVGGDRAFGHALLGALATFVFRREVNPALARELADMLRRTRRELAVDEARDVKLGAGGIREAEFFVQALQLVWGGRYKVLRTPGTIDALRRLVALGLVTDRDAHRLARAWSLLRRVEHRIHMTRGYQTHAIPEDATAKERMARSLGLATADALDETLTDARRTVSTLFASLDAGATDAGPELEALCDLVAAGTKARELAPRVASWLPSTDPDEIASHLARLGRTAESPLGPVTRERMPEFGPMLLREVAETADPSAALRTLADFFVRLGRPALYAKLLAEQPRLLRRLVGLFGGSEGLSALFVSHPEEIDRLLASEPFPDLDEIRDAHVGLAPFPGEAPHEEERFVAQLRSVKRWITLRIGIAHVAGELDLEGATRRLTALADAHVGCVLAQACAEVFARSGPPEGPLPGIVLVGLGKLGGRELGFGGDLDLLVLYAEDGTTRGGMPHTECYARIAQRTMRLLAQPDSEAPGYDADARLRPGGSKGLICAPLAGFVRYHAEQGEPWERQALVRARVVAGDEALAARCTEAIDHIVYGPPPPDPAIVARMRARMQTELAGEARDTYHPKLGHGALVDVEFLVQWLQMAHPDSPSVRTPTTLEALAALRQARVVTTHEAEALADGWSFFRGVEQALRLLGEAHDPHLYVGRRRSEQVARLLGLRDRDGERAVDVLFTTYRRHALEVRRIVEQHLGPIGARAGWA